MEHVVIAGSTNRLSKISSKAPLMNIQLGNTTLAQHLRKHQLDVRDKIIDNRRCRIAVVYRSPVGSSANAHASLALSKVAMAIAVLGAWKAILAPDPLNKPAIPPAPYILLMASHMPL